MLTRRSFLASGSVGVLLPAVVPPPGFRADGVPSVFPRHDPALAQEMVSVAHGNVQRVRELLSGRPALAKAVWDWGYGDWETALGAASHVGHREIADLLISAGAPPTIFSAAALGQLAVVQAMVAATPGVQRAKGPHGISLLSHARTGGADRVVAFLESLGDADPRYTTEPLTDADREAILGSYAFGTASDERLQVLISSRGALMIQREGAVERPLFHLGARVFHPSGAEAVRLRFGPGERAATIRIEDGPLTVTAARR